MPEGQDGHVVARRRIEIADRAADRAGLGGGHHFGHAEILQLVLALTFG